MAIEFFRGISEEEGKEFKEIFDKGGVQAIKKHAGKKFNEWKNISLKIGVIGNSGSGKSSLINAIRGLNGDDEGAAPVGVTETTIEIREFPHPNNEKLVFCDLPGVGTLNFPKDEYLDKIGFKDYDFFLIIASTRFTENDVWLAEEINKTKKRFFFVRTKIHTDVKNDKKSHPSNYNKEKVLQDVKEEISKNLGKMYDDESVFLIDNYKKSLYDFQKLEQQIIEEFPTLKREALILSLSAWNEEMIRKKAETLQKYIKYACIASGAVALIPIPGTSILADSVLLLAQANFFYHQLGLDKKSINRLAKATSSDPNKLLNVVGQRVVNLLTKQGLYTFVNNLPYAALAIAAEEWSRFLLSFGLVIPGFMSMKTTHYISNKILDLMVETSLEVLKAAMENSAGEYTDVIFVIHGIGQKELEDIKETAEKVMETMEDEICGKNIKPMILPIQWRTNLALVDDNIEKVSGNNSPVIQNKKKQLLDILYYLSDHQQELRENLIIELNKAYSSFIKENPKFKGSVSVLSHSLGSVITYDILKNSLTAETLQFSVENFFAIGSPLGLWLLLRKTKVNNIFESNDNFIYFFNIKYEDDFVAHNIEPLFEEVFRKLDNSLSFTGPSKILCDQPTQINSLKVDYNLPTKQGLLHNLPLYPELTGLLHHSAYWESRDLMKFIVEVLTEKKAIKVPVLEAFYQRVHQIIIEKNESLVSKIENTQGLINSNIEAAKCLNDQIEEDRNLVIQLQNEQETFKIEAKNFCEEWQLPFM